MSSWTQSGDVIANPPAVEQRQAPIQAPPMARQTTPLQFIGDGAPQAQDFNSVPAAQTVMVGKVLGSIRFRIKSNGTLDDQDLASLDHFRAGLCYQVFSVGGRQYAVSIPMRAAMQTAEQLRATAKDVRVDVAPGDDGPQGGDAFVEIRTLDCP